MTHLYYVKVSYHYYTLKVMIDTGANISVISLAMLNLLGLKPNRKAGVVYGVGGKAQLIGYKQCNMCIVGPKLVNVEVNLQVLQSDHFSVIFGLDFLEKYKCIVNTNTKKLYLGHHIIPFMTLKELALYKSPIDKRQLKPIKK